MAKARLLKHDFPVHGVHLQFNKMKCKRKCKFGILESKRIQVCRYLRHRSEGPSDTEIRMRGERMVHPTPKSNSEK